MKNQHYNYFIFLIFCFIILFLYYYIILDYLLLKNSNYFKDNYIEYPNYFSKEKSTEMYHFIQNTDIQDNPLNEYFKNSKGLVLQFNNDNAYSTFKSENVTYLYNLFKLLKKSYATDFIMNILIIKSSNNIKKQSIHYHYDTTINKQYTNFLGFTSDYIPECVSVLYINTPQNLNGGELKLYKYNYFNIGNIKPQIGKLVEFNGKLLHGVNNIQNLDNNNTDRISIVLEQYSIN